MKYNCNTILVMEYFFLFLQFTIFTCGISNSEPNEAASTHDNNNNSGFSIIISGKVVK